MSESSLAGSVLKGFVLYKKADTIFHRASPMTKIVYLVVISYLALAMGDIFVLSGIAIFVIICVIVAKVPRSSVKIFTVAVIYMILVFAILWSVVGPYTGTTGGEVLLWIYYQVPYISIPTIIDSNLVLVPLIINFKLYEYNLLNAIRLSLSLFIMALATVLLLTTTTQKEIVYGIKKLGLPYVGAFVLGLTLRAIGMFALDYITIKESLMSRGVNFEKGNVISRIRKLLDIFIPLMIVSLRRINTISDAIESRAFAIGKKRTFYFDIKISKWDFVASGILIAVTVVMSYYRFVYGMFDIGYIDWRYVLSYVKYYIDVFLSQIYTLTGKIF